MAEAIVSSEWLHERIHASDLVILDASASDNQSGLQSKYPNLYIASARHFDLKNDFSDLSSPFPAMFPSIDQFEQKCRILGINNSSTIVVYDNLGVYTSPRVWWMFRAMGHEKVYVLNGGLPDWIQHGFETADSYVKAAIPGNFSAKPVPDQVKDFEFIRNNSTSNEHVVIDARSERRFHGLEKEPRTSLRSGNIPHSINIPYVQVLRNGKLKSAEELHSLFMGVKIDERPLVFSCGSGITACIVLLAAHLVLANKTAVYDGSWTEYGTLTLDVH